MLDMGPFASFRVTSIRPLHAYAAESLAATAPLILARW
jgi:hypothetical protein